MSGMGGYRVGDGTIEFVGSDDSGLDDELARINQSIANYQHIEDVPEPAAHERRGAKAPKKPTRAKKAK